MSFTEAQKDQLVLCSFCFSLLSLLSSLTVAMYYLWFKELRKFAFKLVALTAVCDAIRCIGNLIGSPVAGPLCETQGFLKTFGGVASFFWVGCMAFTIQLICTKDVINPKTLLFRYHCVTWTFAFLSALIPLALDSYVPLSGWCWVTGNNEGVYLRWTSFYGILWFFFVWICYVYISLWWNLKDLDRTKVPRIVSKLWIYPVVLLVCYGPASVRRVWNLVGSPPYALAVIHVCFASLHGFVNAVAYGRNRDIKALNKHLLDKSVGQCFGLREVPGDGNWNMQSTEFNSDMEEDIATSTSNAPALDSIEQASRSPGYQGYVKGLTNINTNLSPSSNVEMVETPTKRVKDDNQCG